jgi:Ran GTPase-activating protein (RanGAP) involved in mRNA processing and transport
MSLNLENVLLDIPKDVWRDVFVNNRANILRLVSTNIKNAIDLIKPFTTVKLSLDINDFRYRISAEKIAKILKEIELLSNRSSIKKISLMKCDIKRDISFNRLKDVIKNCKCIEKLNLSYNEINNNGMNIIAENLIHCSKIKEINLGNNCITDFNSLNLNNFKKLHLIDINSNNCGDIGACSLANVIVNCENISRILLNNNDIGPDGIEKLVKVFGNLKYLKSIDLSDNKLTSKGTEIIASLLSEWKTLFSLDISNNQIGNDGAKHIASVLPYCKSLTNLDLSNNQIYDYGICCFKNVFPRCLVLRYINFNKNVISDEESDSLSDVLANCPNIICLRCI